MTKHNVELFVLSLASPGPQGRHNKEDAEVGLVPRCSLTTCKIYMCEWVGF
jgi:hypothetical protein